MIDHIAETGSTNADLLARAADGAPEGLWLRADIQTGGRGRLGRSWQSPRGNLYASTLVRLRPDDPPAHTLSLVAAIALYEAIRVAVPRADILIKWPNDVLLGGNKLAGILLERQGDAVVIGIGVNLAHAPQLPERVTAALSQIGPAPDAADFCETLAEQFASALQRWRHDGLAAIAEAWSVRAHQPETRLTTTDKDGKPIEGRFAGLTPDAMLKLRLPDGETVIIHSGDIEIEGTSSDAARD